MELSELKAQLEKLHTASFGWALLFSLILSLVTSVLERELEREKRPLI